MSLPEIIEPTVIIAVIVALTQALKQMPIIIENKKWCPTISIAFGLILGVLAGIFFSGEITGSRMVLNGLIYGLSASGLYSFGNQFLSKKY
ncbi:MAG: holin [Clostridiales bacterium]|nr:holin [Clostridiales bacterium]